MISEPRDEKNLAAIESLIQKEIPRLENPLADEPEEEVKETRSSRSRSRSSDDRPKPEATDDKPKRSTRSSRGRKRGDSPADQVGESNKGRGVIVGMGDHLPSFIAMSFDERRAAGL